MSLIDDTDLPHVYTHTFLILQCIGELSGGVRTLHYKTGITNELKKINNK